MSTKITTAKCEKTTCAMWNSRMINKCDGLTEVIKYDCPFYKSDEQMALEKKMLKDRELTDKNFAELRKKYRG